MAMNFMKGFRAAGSALEIASAIVGTPTSTLIQKSETSLTEQYSTYVKEVRLPATARDISRELDRGTRSAALRTRPVVSKKSISKLR